MMAPRNLGRVLVLIALVSSAVSSAVRVLPLGDSNTRGKEGSSYRGVLKDLLLDKSGIVIDYVGSDTTVGGAHGPGHGVKTPYTDAQKRALHGDLEHEGWGGFMIHQTADSAHAWLMRHRPDVVLLLIGTNDIGQNHEMETAPARLGRLIDTIMAAAPRAWLCVASVPPCSTGTPRMEATRRYNAAVRDTVIARKANRKKIEFVDVFSRLDPAADMLPDQVHPNAAGFAKVAQTWYETLAPLLGKKTGRDTMRVQ